MSTRIKQPTSKSPAKRSAQLTRPADPKRTAPPHKPIIKQVPAPRASLTRKSVAPTRSASSPRSSKQAQLITLLRSATGGTIEQMMALTGWQAHTVRGAISGILRKKLGLTVQGAAPAQGRARVYRILEAAA